MSTRHYVIRSLALVALLAVAAACGSDDAADEPANEGTAATSPPTSAGASSNAEPVTLRLGYFPNVTHAPAIIGVEDEVFVDAFGTRASALGDDRSIERWVRSAVGDYVHASSSCAMGRVVDHDGGVVGYQGLSVCDASVFPSIPDVNTHLPTTMLAERLSARWLREASGPTG